MISRQKSFVLWGLWAVLWPGLILTVYIVTNPVVEGRAFDLLSYTVMMGIVALFPIVINNSPIFFIHGLGLAVFLYFGLFFEMMMTQFAYLVMIAKLRLNKAYLYKIPLNTLMFLFVSLGGALVYYALGGTHGASAFDSPMDAIPIIGYGASVLLINHLLIYFIRNYFIGMKGRFFDREFFWDMGNTAIVVPIGFVLCVLYMEIGAAAIYYVGLPFVGLSLILTLYYSSRRINSYLQKTNEIGQELTEKLEVHEVLDRFVANLSSLFDLNYAYVFDVQDGREMQLIRYYDGDRNVGFQNPQFHSYEGLSRSVLHANGPVHYQKRKQWGHIKSDLIPIHAESVMAVPIERNNKVVGVLTIVSNKKRAYEKFQYMILGILANYLAVAIENARHYEETKRRSERCSLTRLYNYRYFEDLLQNYAEDDDRTASVILLDLDHFKMVNDQYGHESGNEALCELANRLTRVIGDLGTVARYGGEEFVVFLPQFSREKAYEMAETIRESISSYPFELNEHITDLKGEVHVHLTASIGVATYPDDCESPIELIRHADRAMYVGAKQKGRNKVATYERVLQAAE